MIRGAILTSAPTLDYVRQHTQGLDALKIVAQRGLPWTPALMREALRLRPLTLLRTLAGDPAAGDHGADHRWPLPEKVVAEISPWWDVRDPARPFWIEIGNEPLIEAAPEQYAWDYTYWLEKTLDAVATAFPGARLVFPAHLLNHLVPLGSHPDGVKRFLEVSARLAGRFHALGLHAYNLAQYERGRMLLRSIVSPSLPIWVTEFGLNEDLPPHVRGAAYARTVARMDDAEAVFLYHLASEGGADPTHFNPRYQLDRVTVASFVDFTPEPPPMAPSLAALSIVDLRPRLSVIEKRVPARRPGKPTSITLHYNGPAVAGFGSPAKELAQIIGPDTKWHQDNPGIAGDSLQYHYCVLSDGSIYQTRAIELPASHCGHTEGNRFSLAVHLPLGGLQDATPVQWARTLQLFEALRAEHQMPKGRDAVRGHFEWKSATECPGPRLKPRLAAWRQGEAPQGGMWRVKGDVPAALVREGPGRTFPVALGGKARMYPGDTLDADAVTQGEAVGGDVRWLHRRDGVGFVHMSLVEAL